VKAARARIVIMAGGGIDDNNAVNIIEHTGVREIHVGLGSSSESPMLHRNRRISMGTALGREYQRSQVAEEDVMNLRRAVTLARRYLNTACATQQRSPLTGPFVADFREGSKSA
jgi:copper homeostasis protein CutC